MKKKLIIIFLLIGITATSQITLSAYQDLKLATQDDGHGNQPFTTDVVLQVKFLNGGNREDNWSKNIFAGINFEYADLNSRRFLYYGLMTGYKFKLPLRIEIAPYISYGIIERWGSTLAFNSGLDIGYRITPKIKLSVLNTFIQRTDLEIYEPNQWRYSFLIGIEILIIK